MFVQKQASIATAIMFKYGIVVQAHSRHFNVALKIGMGPGTRLLNYFSLLSKSVTLLRSVC